MINGNEQQALVTRLNRIEGQVRGIRRMVQEPRLCIEILQQLAAAACSESIGRGSPVGEVRYDRTITSQL